MTENKSSKLHVNMQDVADKAEVSKATVSKVLNNRKDVSDKARKKVLNVCEELGYRLNPSIQDLLKRGVTGHSQDIAFVLVDNSFSDPAYSGMTEGFSIGCEKYNLHLILSRLSGQEKRVYDLPPALRDRRVGGILISGSITPLLINLINQLEIPYIVIGNYSSAITSQTNSVHVEIGNMMFNLVRGLKERGKKRIAFFYDDPDNFYFQQCYENYRLAIQGNGFDYDDSIVYRGNAKYYNILNTMMPIIEEKGADFDSIICLNFFGAQELVCLLIAKYGIEGAAEFIIATTSCFSKRLPIPALFCEEVIPKLTETGLDMLMQQLKSNVNERKSISFTPLITYI